MLALLYAKSQSYLMTKQSQSVKKNQVPSFIVDVFGLVVKKYTKLTLRSSENNIWTIRENRSEPTEQGEFGNSNELFIQNNWNCAFDIWRVVVITLFFSGKDDFLSPKIIKKYFGKV